LRLCDIDTVGAVTSTDTVTTSHSGTRTWFRAVAVAEAVSWLGLLVAMFFKWVVQDDPHAGVEGGVPVMGPIHGAIFVGYVAMCFVARSRFAWSARTTLVALVAAVPPFATAVFEAVADRRGLLVRR
jgi:integral membrane protein